MRTLLEAQYEDKSKSKGWAVFWSIIPAPCGFGNFYAKNYGVGALFLVGETGLFSVWIKAATKRDTADVSAGAYGLLYLGVRVLDCVVAARSVGKYNQRLREKYGLILNAVPYKDKLYATATFDF
jgi:hypothetical protein